jgi:S1-C subfamily serine protease
VGIVAQQTTDGRVLIKSLIEGGAAGKAGLLPEDVILEANGKPIKSFDDLAGALGGLHAGDVVTLKIRRGEKDEELKVTLEEKAG